VSDFDNERLPEELEAVAARLRAAKGHRDPLQLDQIKQGVIARCSAQPRGAYVKERIATVATIFALVGGTGGAIAIGASGLHGGSQGGAATAQYNSKKTKCRKGTHRVRNKCVKNGRKSKAGVRGQNNSRSRKHSANKGATRSPTASGRTPGFTG
jgi:hypothetical protein